MVKCKIDSVWSESNYADSDWLFMCPIEIWAVAWTQGSLEPVCREERKRGRRGLKQGQARLVE